MYLTFRYRVKGTASKRRLDAMAESVNAVWNYCNDMQRHALRWRLRWPTDFDLCRATAGSSKELGLGAVSIQCVCRQYTQSRTQHRKRKLRYRSKRALGWIPFRGESVRIHGDTVQFLGQRYRLWLSRAVGGEVRWGSFARDARGRWYLNLMCEVEAEQKAGQGQVGVDLGLITLATMSDGAKERPGKFDAACATAYAMAQRAQKKKLARALRAKARNKRLDAHHKLSDRLVRENRVIAVGNVKPRPLLQTHMASAVKDAGWSQLRYMLRYKAIGRGAQYIEVDEAFSSQLCSACGTLPASRPTGIAQLRIREWVCSNCGQGHDRDINAARNILALGCQRLAEGARPMPGDTKFTTW